MAREDYTLVEISATLVHETDMAWLLDDGDQRVWIPKSQCERVNRTTWEMPERIAIDKELI